MDQKAEIKKIGDKKDTATSAAPQPCISPQDADMADVVDAELQAVDHEQLESEWCKKHNTRKGNCGCLWESKIN